MIDLKGKSITALIGMSAPLAGIPGFDDSMRYLCLCDHERHER